jgi:hypothetical protein
MAFSKKAWRYGVAIGVANARFFDRLSLAHIGKPIEVGWSQFISGCWDAGATNVGTPPSCRPPKSRNSVGGAAPRAVAEVASAA